MFTVPIIPPDLRHEETIIQAAYALDCLQKTINTIFGHIDKRIEKNNNKVKELQERLQKSQRKINSLQGTRKAIHIYAPARFPASNIFKDIPVTFDKGERAEIPRSILSNAEKYQVKTKLDPNLPNINEKLIFFHVREQNHQKFAPETSLAKERLKIKPNQDLGNMPSDLRSIPSVLLFNTDYSVYDLDDSEAAGRSDAWKRVKLFKNKRQQYGNQQQSTAKQILEPAPHSLAHRNEKLTPSGGLKYTPKLCEAPELDLPLDLPDLPGIADDLRYESLEAKQKIAPSLAMVVENLPELTELMKEKDMTVNIPGGSPNKEQVNAAKTIATMTPPPPPPPPPPSSASLNVNHQAPPPPPPPPSFLNPTTKGNTINTPHVSATDTRSELMAAIRNAGGSSKAHLRHTAAAPLTNSNKDDTDSTTSKLQNSQPQKPIAKASGGDLMADLHNKLLMRRKGISGSKDNTDNSIRNNTNSLNDAPSGNPVISRLSSLIPPPPTKDKNRTKVNTTSDEDDSNDTDWVD